MANHSANRLGEFVRDFCREAIPLTDAELWERFTTSADADSFEVLLYRHGPMVLACAHRVLGDRHLAEDVFQATFLSLARSRDRLRTPQGLAAWLYRTAYRLALRSRSRKKEQPLPEQIPAGDPVGDHVSWREVQQLLDEELHRLPERLRAPLLLCYLCGHTRDEAARHLGCSFDVLKRRLEQGRELLRVRLEQRGIREAALTLAVLSPELLQATVSRPLVEQCLGLVFTPGLPIPTAVTTMLTTVPMITKGMMMKSVFALLTLVGLGVWVTTQDGTTQEPLQRKTPPKNVAEVPMPPEAQGKRADHQQRRRSQENLKKIMIAVHNYEAAWGHLPADIRDKQGKLLLSWRVVLLPYIDDEGAKLFKQFKLEEAWDSEHNFKLLSQMPSFYRLGTEEERATHTYYQVFSGPNAPLSYRSMPGAEGGMGMMGGGSGFGGMPGGPPGGVGFGGEGSPGGVGGGESGSGTPTPSVLPLGSGGVPPKDQTKEKPVLKRLGSPPAPSAETKSGPPLGSPGGGPGGSGMGPGGGLSGGPGGALGGAGAGEEGGGIGVPIKLRNGVPDLGNGPIRLSALQDGLSNTFGVIEAGPAVAWTKPADIAFTLDQSLPALVGPFSNAIHVSMMDGTVWAMKRGLNEQILRSMITFNDGMITPNRGKLHAALPPETAEEREALKKKAEETSRLFSRYAELQKENTALIGRIIRNPLDFNEVDEMIEEMKREILTEETKNRELKKAATEREQHKK